MSGWRSVLLALAVSLAGASEGWHRPFAVMGPDQGIPNGGITCITQDSDGFLWLGTESGLLRYEGGQCSRWTREDGLPSDFVHGLLPDPEGGLWVSTLHGLARFRQGRLVPVRLEAMPAVTGLQGMALDAAGHLWVAAGQGLFVQDQDLEFHRYPNTQIGRVTSLANGRMGTMHLGSDRGLFTLHKDGSVESWSAKQGLPETQLELMAEDGAGRLWVSSGRKLVMREPGARKFTDQSHLLKAAITPNAMFFKDADGSLWVPTQAGALRLHHLGDSLLDASVGLPMRWVRHVFRDREGVFWILGATLARLQGHDRVWNNPLAAGPTGGMVWSILRNPLGHLLVGTDDGVTQVGAAATRQIPGTAGHRVKGMAFDRSGRLWMVGPIGSALWLPPGRTTAIPAPLGELSFGLNTVMADSSGQVWLSHSQKGIFRWDEASHRMIHEVGPDMAAFGIREDAMGRIWAATSLGLHVRDRSGSWRLFTEKDGILPFGLLGMAFLPDGSAWIHSRESQGLMRIRIEADRVVVLERRRKGQGLRSDLVYAVGVDPKGRTWATTDQGFDCLDARLHVGRLEGMANEDCSLLALLPEEACIWVGTSAGLTRYETGQGESVAPAPQPHILRVIRGSQRLEAPFDAFGPVGYAEANLAFRVAVPSYLHEGQMKVQARLVGLEEAWRELDAPLTRYQALPGGSYRFEARAAQPDGEFGPTVSMSFRVLPPWWRAWWALVLWGCGFVLLGLLFLRLRLAALAKSKAELEALVSDRTEELRARNVELTEAMGRVKQLSGLLPICAACKKIRDDKGYWSQLEHYLSEHSEVGFTHGICPDCAGQYFPGHGKRESGSALELPFVTPSGIEPGASEPE